MDRNGSELRKPMRDSHIKKLKEKGLKLTSQRLAIIEVLVDMTPVHPSANLIYQEARKRGTRLSLSTVYATLNELSRHGIIKMLEFDKMENRFEANMTEHINLICKGCKKITDYKRPIIIDANEISKKCRFRVTDSRLEYYGYCQECSKK
jgi:Fe2+ or Zn2+ uptake regulation protein